jgi:hypothetical protein
MRKRTKMVMLDKSHLIHRAYRYGTVFFFEGFGAIRPPKDMIASD